MPCNTQRYKLKHTQSHGHNTVYLSRSRIETNLKDIVPYDTATAALSN